MPMQIFKSDRTLYPLIKKHTPKFDENKSLFASRFSFYDVDGNFYDFRNLIDMINLLNGLANKPFLCPKRSRASGRALYKIWILDSQEEAKLAEVQKEVEIKVEEEEKEEVGQVFSLEDMMKEVDAIAIETGVIEEVVEDEKVQPDWVWINSLENKKYDKEKLDVYAEKEFGIKLNKRNTLSNMIKDLKEQL